MLTFIGTDQTLRWLGHLLVSVFKACAVGWFWQFRSRMGKLRQHPLFYPLSFLALASERLRASFRKHCECVASQVRRTIAKNSNYL